MDDTTTRHASQAVIQTAKASGYLQQLCKHFAHKVPATWDAHSGRVDFAMGACAMAAPEGEGRLTLAATAGSAEALAQVQEIVGGHLERFAFREPLVVAWTAATPGA